MNTNEKLNQIYKLFSEKKYSEAFVLVQEILKTEPQNIYAKRYESLLKPYLNDKSEVGKIATIKGKNLKCPHCEASIKLSALNEEQKTKIRTNDYSNLSLKCPYCHTNFTLQKKSSESIIGINIGDKINYNWKKYRVVGSVEYSGTWEEGYYHGNLNYLEWILLGEDNSYLYFSEGYFFDDGEKKYEFEFSEKIIPDFSIKFENNLFIFINGKKIDIKELNRVNVSSIYGENSKVFQVGEEITLYNFSYLGQDYVLEKESAGRQSEAGIYKAKSVNSKKAFSIFGKENNSNIQTPKMQFNSEEIKNYGAIFIFVGIFFVEIFGIYMFFIIISLLFFIWIYFFKKEIFYSKFFHFFISGPIFCGIFFTILSNIFETKKEISLQDISNGKKFQIIFENPELQEISEISKKTYDYGGVETIYSRKEGLEFSVKSENDKKIIEKIKNGEKLSEDVEKIFSEKIYKLK